MVEDIDEQRKQQGLPSAEEAWKGELYTVICVEREERCLT